MVSFNTLFEEIPAMNLSLVRPIEPVIDENPSEIHGSVPLDAIPELIIQVSGVRGYLEA